jgi:large subunit ribosomal protein L25
MVPGSLFSIKGQGEQEGRLLLSFDKRDIVQLYRGLGMYGWACQVFDIDVEDMDGSLKTYRALGRQIHVTASSGEPENVTMISFYPGRKVKVNVPLKTFGSEVSPGIKSGGRVNWIRRTIPCLVSSGQVPTHFEVDISNLVVNDKFLWKELDIPSNVSVLLQDPRQPVLKIARR